MSLTCLPRRVSQFLRVLRPCFRHRHQLAFSWLLVLHLLYGERANLKALARHGPPHLAYQQYRRLLCAAYRCTQTLLWWFADQALQALPPPEGGILSVVGDRTLKGKRGPKHPVAQKTRLSQHHPDVFGCRIVLLMAQWGVCRIPVDCALVRRQDDPDHAPENALFRQMLPAFRPPPWCQEVVVVADAAYLTAQHEPRARVGLLVRVCPATDLEVHHWEGAQNAGHPSAALVGHPDPDPYSQRATPPDLLGLCQTGPAAPSGRRDGGAEHMSAQRWANTDQDPRDQSARDGERA
jgi:hypothetical protein